ncbi:unnamed protein product [Protopolystoma xenopodis]|uniref:Uncharacterized protein n=1 Tax=Protopolystoma xenopodis TaxID=117903 RepID=A0A3S5AWX8_9PLAT|nr:unnamed protein product [Protopolystoma xenopodis]
MSHDGCQPRTQCMPVGLVDPGVMEPWRNRSNEGFCPLNTGLDEKVAFSLAPDGCVCKYVCRFVCGGGMRQIQLQAKLGLTRLWLVNKDQGNAWARRLKCA